MSRKGTHLSEEHKKIISLCNKNRIWSEESRHKMSIIKKGQIPSEKHRLLNSIRFKGVKFTEEHKEKIRNALLGKKKSPEHVKKMSLAMKEKMGGANNPHWKGGVPESYFSSQYRVRKLNCKGSHTNSEWEQLKKIFGNICPSCGKEEKLHKDHIIPLTKNGTDYIYNIQPLCRICNSKKKTKIIAYPKWGERMYA